MRDLLGYRALARKQFRLPADDELLDAKACSKLLSPNRKDYTWWYGYACRHESLVEGYRTLRSSGKDTDGTRRWLKSAVVYHIRVELMQGPDAEIDPAEGKRRMARRGAA